MEVSKLGNIYGFDGGNYAGNVYDLENIAPTLRSHSGGNTEPMIVHKDNILLERASICIGGLQEHQTARTDGISPSLTAAMGMGGGQTPMINDFNYRIRKLTPLECWRLMDFSDEDFHKAESVNSNSQLYKQAGNSIVKNVLVAIFGQMIPGKEKVYMESEE